MRLTKVGLAVITALLASGCSDDDSTSSASTPAKLNFSIQGIATDAPIANALITARIGDRTVTTTANETGNYSLNFEYNEDSFAGTEMVEVTAKGEGQQSHIELISQLGSFDMLLEQAGEDNIAAAKGVIQNCNHSNQHCDALFNSAARTRDFKLMKL